MLNFLDMPQAEDKPREEWDYEQSRKTVHLSFFVIHLVFFAVTNFFFIIINLFTAPTKIWFLYPLIIWGFFVGVHYYLMVGLLNKKFDPWLQKIQSFLGL